LGESWLRRRRGRLCDRLRRLGFAWGWDLALRRLGFAWRLDFALRRLDLAWWRDFPRRCCFSRLRLGARLFRMRADARNVEIDITDLATHRLETNGVLRDGDRLALGLGRSPAEV
jgi:hypothetical protein